MTQLSKAVFARIPHYFNEAKRKLMNNLNHLLDPKSYSLYDTFDASSSHGNNIIESALKYYKYKKWEMIVLNHVELFNGKNLMLTKQC